LYRRLRGEIAVAALKNESAEVLRSWEVHLRSTRQLSQGARFLSSIRLLCESWACDALVRRTVLYPTGREEVRFIHREWQDFLASRYLAQLITYRNVDELRHIGFTARMCRIAGELLYQAGIRVDESLVFSILRRSREMGSRLIAANFSALLSSSVPIDGAAIDAYLSALNSMPVIARCLALIGLGYRALRDGDPSAHDLRYRLIPIFRDYLSVVSSDGIVGLIRSSAWCYLKAYAQRFGTPMPTGAWPGFTSETEVAVLAMMSSTSEGSPRILDEHRSVQLAFLELQHVAPDDPCRPISVAHYLYCLVLARRHGAGIAELSRELPLILAPDSRYMSAIESYELVPELQQIVSICRQLNALH